MNPLNLAQYGLAPHGYYDSHDAWEHHEIIVAFHNLNEQKRNPVEFTAEDRELIARAYVLHDNHYGRTWQENVESFNVPQEKKYSAFGDDVGRHVTDVLKEHPEYIDALMAGHMTMNQVVAGFQYEPYWVMSEAIYHELQTCVTNGQIHDLHSYYQYMVQNHYDEIIAYGW